MATHPRPLLLAVFGRWSKKAARAWRARPPPCRPPIRPHPACPLLAACALPPGIPCLPKVSVGGQASSPQRAASPPPLRQGPTPCRLAHVEGAASEEAPAVPLCPRQAPSHPPPRPLWPPDHHRHATRRRRTQYAHAAALPEQAVLRTLRRAAGITAHSVHAACKPLATRWRCAAHRPGPRLASADAAGSLRRLQPSSTLSSSPRGTAASLPNLPPPAGLSMPARHVPSPHPAC